VIIVPFKLEHLKNIKLQSAQAGILDNIEPYGAYVEASDFGFTAMDGDEVVACAGIIKMWEGRGHAWALLSDNIGGRFVQLHRAVKRALAMSGYKRIEMVVDADFAEGLKWAHMLGFKCETPDGMPGYATDNRLYKLFARVT